MTRGIITRLFVVLYFVFCLGAFNQAHAQQKIPTDKAAYFGIAAASQTTCAAIGNAITRSRVGSVIGCFLMIDAAGVVKEMNDPLRGSQREVNDIYANLAGSGLSFLTLCIAF